MIKKWKAYKEKLREKNIWLYRLADTIETFGVALVIALVIRQYVVMSSIVPTGSMIPTLNIKDRLFVNKFVYRFSTPKRGDIVVFKSPRKDKKDYVKRCIGLPGDKVKLEKGYVYINDKPLILAGVNIRRDYYYFDEVIVPTDNYFVLGDNRGHSWDARYWPAAGLSGFVPKKDLEGKALFTWWPLNRMRVLQ
jgi:signal peptidase I